MNINQDEASKIAANMQPKTEAAAANFAVSCSICERKGCEQVPTVIIQRLG